MQKLLNFTQLHPEQHTIILSWRNHKNIRKWMLDMELISEQTHLAFVEKLKRDKTKKYFLVHDKDKYLGTINLINICTKKQEAELGLYADPFNTLRGVGSILLRLCLEYAFETLQLKRLRLVCYEENIRALYLYKKFDFKEYAQKKIQDRKVICMELKNENR